VRPEIDPDDEIIEEESTETPYNYMVQAWLILSVGRAANWKTVEMIRTLRQAIREATAQGMPIEIPLPAAGRLAVRQFLSIARYFDKIHHGAQTF
jgi:hypothetical protein